MSAEEHDATKLYEVRRLIPNRLSEHYPQYALEVYQEGYEEIGPYPGVLLVDAEERPDLDALIVRWRKVPGWYAVKLLEKQRKEREASR